jgi:biotin operon repressor
MDIKEKFTVGITKDYDLFKFLDTNRKPNQRMIEKLTNSIKENGIQIPIIVSPEKYIVDGQHRFWALRSLKYSVPYIISKTWKDDNHTIEINNTSKKWTALDYANYAAKSGNLDIAEALEISEQWEKETCKKLKATSGLEILMQGRTHSGLLSRLKNQTYIIDRKKGIEIYDTLNIMSEYKMKVSPFTQKFVRAIKVLNYEFGDLTEKVVRRMCLNNYIQSYNKENDQIEYLADLYKEAKNKYKNKNK